MTTRSANISVPKMTRICTVCKERSFLNGDAISLHREHGGLLVKVPKDFCRLHQKAFKSLTPEWQLYKFCSKEHTLPFQAYEDLVAWGFAESHIQNLYQYGQPRGSQHYYRVKQNETH